MTFIQVLALARNKRKKWINLMNVQVLSKLRRKWNACF